MPPIEEILDNFSLLDDFLAEFEPTLAVRGPRAGAVRRPPSPPGNLRGA